MNGFVRIKASSQIETPSAGGLAIGNLKLLLVRLLQDGDVLLLGYTLEFLA